MWGKIYWPIALTVASVIMFGIPELIALFTNPANTLSDYSWSELNVTVAYGHGIHTVAWWASIVVWFVFVVVITIHIWWRGA